MFKKEVIKLIGSEIKKGDQEIDGLLETPPNPEMGDFAFPCFILSKELKSAPNTIATDLASKLKPTGSISRIEAKGPYLNFYLTKADLAESILSKVYKEKDCYGKKKSNNKTVVIEFPAPNTNKPLHLGHVRNLLLGESVARILEANGYKVVRVDLINDRGIHICKSMYAYQKWGDGKQPDKKSDHFVGDYYVLYNTKVKDDPKIEEETRKMLLLWENRDRTTIDLWKQMNKWAIDGFNQTYKRLGIAHEKVYLESKMFEQGRAIVLDGLKKGVFQKDKDGNVLAPLEEYGMPNRVLLRADGTSIYITQDVYLAQNRYEDFHYSKSIYVVGNEQNLHFQQLFKVLELLGFKQAKDCYHLSYGMVSLPEGKMKSREGTVVDADDLFDSVKDLAKKEIQKRHKLNNAELEERAETIGMGGLRFFVLKYDPQKDFMYNPQESISFEGETGPYIQYTHARICSILRKHGNETNTQIDFSKLSLESEKNLISTLADYPAALEESAKNYKPSTLARHLLSLSQQFNEYYHKTPVLKADKETMEARLLLIYCVKEVIKSGLNLLGIQSPEEM